MLWNTILHFPCCLGIELAILNWIKELQKLSVWDLIVILLVVKKKYMNRRWGKILNKCAKISVNQCGSFLYHMYVFMNVLCFWHGYADLSGKKRNSGAQIPSLIQVHPIITRNQGFLVLIMDWYILTSLVYIFKAQLEQFLSSKKIINSIQWYQKNASNLWCCSSFTTL